MANERFNANVVLFLSQRNQANQFFGIVTGDGRRRLVRWRGVINSQQLEDNLTLKQWP